MTSKEIHKYGTDDGWHGVIEEGGQFPPEKDRYHLYIGEHLQLGTPRSSSYSPPLTTRRPLLPLRPPRQPRQTPQTPHQHTPHLHRPALPQRRARMALRRDVPQRYARPPLQQPLHAPAVLPRRPRVQGEVQRAAPVGQEDEPHRQQRERRDPAVAPPRIRLRVSGQKRARPRFLPVVTACENRRRESLADIAHLLGRIQSGLCPDTRRLREERGPAVRGAEQARSPAAR